MVKLEYIYNSGFSLEIGDHFLVIDYYKGELRIPEGKRLSFLVTHGHEDHYNPDIFQYEDAHYIISDDVEGLEAGDRLALVHPGDELDFNDIRVKVLSSTDQGSSFYLEVEGVKIFHGGDLNWWAWEDQGPQRELEREQEYTSEINKLDGLDIDLAFIAVDPRLRHNYYLAGDYFIRRHRPRYFFPMHFGDNYSYNEKFIHKMQGTSTHIFNIQARNQKFQLEL